MKNLMTFLLLSFFVIGSMVVLQNKPSFNCDNFDTLSDRRLKNVGEPFNGGLKEINKLRAFNYTFRDDIEKLPHVGIMAQDLSRVFPNAVAKAPDGFFRIRKEEIFYSLINAVKELDAKNVNLTKRVIDLETQNQELIKKNTDLEKENKVLEKKIEDMEKRLVHLEKSK